MLWCPLGAVTEAIDRHHSVVEAHRPRFVYYRMLRLDRAQRLRARHHRREPTLSWRATHGRPRRRTGVVVRRRCALPGVPLARQRRLDRARIRYARARMA